MDGQVRRYFCLVFCVIILYHDMCTFAITAHRKRKFYKSEGSYDLESELQNILYLSESNGQPWEHHNQPRMLETTPSTDTQIEEQFLQVKERDANEDGFEKVLVENEKVSNQVYLEDLTREGYNVTNENDICADWQEFDGTTCVCSDHCSTNSDINMGMVCDYDGKWYPNLCDFTYKMCSEQILASTTLTTCGVCNTLKLTGSQIYPEDKTQGLGIFKRDATGNTWTAVDDQGTTMKLFHSIEAMSWVVGSADQTQAGIVFKTYTPNPQDSIEGAVVIVNETYGEFDPFLHLECLPDTAEIVKRETNPLSREKTNPLSREKRFGFLVAMAVIAIVATTAQVTVTAIQKKRGCLFYQDVCDMKKEINRMKPEVESLKGRFESIIGEPLGFKDMVHNVFQQLLDLKENMIELRKLENEFRDLSETVGPDLKFLSPDISNDFDTSFHDQWLKALGKETTWGVIGLIYVQMPLEMISVLTSTASKASMAFAAFGAVISVVAAVIGIVVSWQNEKSQREQLRKVKRNLIDAKQRLTTALSHVKSFQISFYKKVIYPLKKFTHHMRNYDRHFQTFYNHLVSTYGSTLSPNVGENVYGKIKSYSVKTLKDKHLTPLTHFLSFKLKELKEKIKSYKQTENLITLIRNNINEQTFPKEILSLVKKVHGKTAEKIVPNEFLLLKFTAEKVLHNKGCYWGYNLDGIRKGSVTNSNYKSVPLCNSPELLNIESSFQKLTGQNLSPDQIVNRIQYERFTDKYQKLKFLADFILPSKPCYWGYNLELIRSDKIPESEIVKAKPSKAAFSSMKLLPENLQATALCSAIHVCNPNWQKYVKCLFKTFDGGNMCKGAAKC